METLPRDLNVYLFFFLSNFDLSRLSKVSVRLYRACNSYLPWVEWKREILALFKREWFLPTQFEQICNVSAELNLLHRLFPLIKKESPLEPFYRLDAAYLHFSRLGRRDLLKKLFKYKPARVSLCRKIIYEAFRGGHVSLAKSILDSKDSLFLFPEHVQVISQKNHVVNIIRAICECLDPNSRLEGLFYFYSWLTKNHYNNITPLESGTFYYAGDDEKEMVNELFSCAAPIIISTKEWTLWTLHASYDSQLDAPTIAWWTINAGWEELFFRYYSGPSEQDKDFLQEACKKGRASIFFHLLKYHHPSELTWLLCLCKSWKSNSHAIMDECISRINWGKLTPIYITKCLEVFVSKSEVDMVKSILTHGINHRPIFQEIVVKLDYSKEKSSLIDAGMIPIEDYFLTAIANYHWDVIATVITIINDIPLRNIYKRITDTYFAYDANKRAYFYERAGLSEPSVCTFSTKRKKDLAIFHIIEYIEKVINEREKKME